VITVLAGVFRVSLIFTSRVDLLAFKIVSRSGKCVIFIRIIANVADEKGVSPLCAGRIDNYIAVIVAVR
jgi:hypothetical protein